MTPDATSVAPRTVHGTVGYQFQPVLDLFTQLADENPDWDAQFCVYSRGEQVVDLSTSDRDWITGVFSASKGIAAITLSTLIRDGQLDLEQRVAHYWPEFAAEGKGEISVGTLLSHQAGLVGVDGGFELDEILHSELGAARLAATRPLWVPGSSFGYHGITIGIFMEELVRRIAGTTLHELYEKTIREPRQIDFYLGLPTTEEHRYRDIYPPAAGMPTPPSGASPDSLTDLMFNSVGQPSAGPHADSLSPNHAHVRAVGPSAVGGVGSARGIARAYASALGMDGSALLDPKTIELVSQQRSWGHDRILNVINAFATVFMKTTPRVDVGSYRAFGHDGAGAVIGFADPLYDLALGYVPHPMRAPGSDPLYLQLRAATTACVTREAENPAAVGSS